MSLHNVLSTNAYILMYEMETETQKQSLPKKELSNGFTNSTNGKFLVFLHFVVHVISFNCFEIKCARCLYSFFFFY